MPSQQKQTMKNRTILLFIVIAITVGCRTSNKNIDAISFYSDCQSAIDSIHTANPESIGIMVHIESPKDNLSWSGCSGYSNKDERTKLISDQPALIASCTKPYISATILRLQELGLLTIEDSISRYLTEETIQFFEKVGYDFDSIKIKHLLSQTSGIKEYADGEYLNRINENKKYRWTREEQLRLAASKGKPLGSPEEVWSYSDANFLLCAEIIESTTKKPFYTTIRDLLKYKDLGFRNTWFPTLEKPNANTKSLVHQYWGSWNWDSYEMDPSFDLYGGGGIATTTEELAKFSLNLFQGNIIEDTITLNKLFTKIIPSDGKDSRYLLGVGEGSINGFTYYWHGGFWGTNFLYFPELEASIAVYVLERDKSQLAYGEVPNLIVKLLEKQLDRRLKMDGI